MHRAYLLENHKASITAEMGPWLVRKIGLHIDRHKTVSHLQPYISRICLKYTQPFLLRQIRAIEREILTGRRKSASGRDIKQAIIDVNSIASGRNYDSLDYRPIAVTAIP